MTDAPFYPAQRVLPVKADRCRPQIPAARTDILFTLTHRLLTSAPARCFGLDHLWLRSRLDRLERLLGVSAPGRKTENTITNRRAVR